LIHTPPQFKKKKKNSVFVQQGCINLILVEINAVLLNFFL